MVSTIITARKRSCGKVMFLSPANEVWGNVIFLHLFVILFTGGGLPQCMLGDPPRRRHPPGGDPSEEAPPRRRPPRGGTPLRYPSPRHRACWEIQSTCGRYASYWNAILLHLSVILFTGWGGCIPACNGRGGGCLPLGPGGANLWSHSSLDLPLKWSKTILLFTSL